MTHSSSRLLDFVVSMTKLVQATSDESRLLEEAEPLMRDLVSNDDWLPDAMAASDPVRYQQYLLYGDPFDRFSLVSFVWGPGQKTPIHDHTVWGIIGMLRGSESAQRYVHKADGSMEHSGSPVIMKPGDIDKVSPAIGDIHEVGNALDDRASISIHLYGGNIGRTIRHVFDPKSGETEDFVSGYSNQLTPNLWSC